MSLGFRAAVHRISEAMQAPTPKYGRDRLSAHTVTAKQLILDGRTFTAASLGGGCSGCVGAAASTAAQSATAVQVPETKTLDGPAPVREEVLVRHDPDCKPAIERERAERNLQHGELQRAIQELAAAEKRITLERTAVKRGKQWYVGGERIAASKLKISDGSSRRFITEESTIEEALRKLAAELDLLHSGAGAFSSTGDKDAE